MSGHKTKLVDLGKAAQRLTGAMLAADQRKRQYISELSKELIRKGKSPWLAVKQAEEHYNLIHKHEK